jgi:signal transduction histidine kinase
VTVLVSVLAVLVAGALITLSTVLHRTTVSSGMSVESVRLAEDVEIDLLMHRRAADALVRRGIEGDLRQKLAEAKRFVTTEEEARVLAEAQAQVDRYIAASHDPGRSEAEREARHEAAYEALEDLVDLNVAQSREAQRVAARWDALADALGLTVSGLALLAAVTLLVWLRRRAFQPVLRLASAMERFGRGDREARAEEEGPSELREMCARFNEMAAAMASQRQAQTAFLGGVAHDLRNPLSALKMSVELLRADGQLPAEGRLRRTIERIERQIERMDRMLGDLLDVAKIEAGQLDLRPETYDARKLVEEVAELLEGSAREHSIEVRLPDEAVPVCCDPLRMEQVITNLVTNALRYSPPGSAVEIALVPRGNEVELSVTDHGVGISEEDRDRIFDPFQRAGASKDSVRGVGLGLYVVRKIVEAHRGRIEIRSAPGQGSTFRVFVPVR